MDFVTEIVSATDEDSSWFEVIVNDRTPDGLRTKQRYRVTVQPVDEPATGD